MPLYGEVANIYRDLLYALQLTLTISDFGLFVFMFLQLDNVKHKRKIAVMQIIMIIVGVVILIYSRPVQAIANWKPEGERPFLYYIPYPIVLMTTLIIAALTIYRIRALVVWWKTDLSAFSIKHSMDALAEGLMYYDENGSISLVNENMNEISLSIRGKPIRNAKEFYRDLMSGEYLPKESILLQEPGLILIRSGDYVYSLRETAIENEFGQFTELRISDITEEYGRTQELSDKQSELRKQQEYLNKIGEDIKQLTIKKEILAAKINVHDRLGENLIAARRYLATGEGDIGAIQELWFSNLDFLNNPQTIVMDNPLESILDAADDIGIDVIFEGEVTAEEIMSLSRTEPNNILTLLANTLHECITNTMRHAHGDKVVVTIGSNFNTMTFTNNGDAPTTIVRESGGLLNIRKQADALGYKMIIISQPEYKLILKNNYQGE